MKKIVILIIALLTISQASAFPATPYNGTANATNIVASIDVLSIPFVGLGVSADIGINDTRADAANYTTSASGSVLSLDTGLLDVVLGETAASQPNATNPITDTTNLLGVNQSPVSLGVASGNSFSALLDFAGNPSSDFTNSRSSSTSSVDSTNVGVPILSPNIIEAGVITASSTVDTSDVSETVAQGLDAITCESTSVVSGLRLLDGVVSADAVTTYARATTNGVDGDVILTVDIANLFVGGALVGDVTVDVNTLPPASISLLGNTATLSIAPDFSVVNNGDFVSASATAIRLDIGADVVGLGAGTSVEVGKVDATCEAQRGNFNPSDDTDGDGVRDADDLDDDNDGIPDTEEGDAIVDTDGDGIPDSRDLDSDNDGALDVIEAGHADKDLNGDGQVDGDVGLNGLSDLVETAPDSDVVTQMAVDTDGDNVPDYRDLDSDNDGTLDVAEAGHADLNGDGLVDGDDDDFDGILASVDNTPLTYGSADRQPLPDADGDGVPNILDLDSDNDGVLDVVEGGFEDLDNDGMVDGDDNDNDGIVDAVDNALGQFGTDVLSLFTDTDNDNVPDIYDLDSDNDGILDIEEAGYDALDPDGNGFIDVFADDDSDGIVASRDSDDLVYGSSTTQVLPDADSDDTPDMQELDSDNDGEFDFNQLGGEGVDEDDDGMADGDDLDNDGIPFSSDTDPDNFGVGTPTAVSLRSVNASTSVLLTVLLAATALLAVSVRIRL